MVKKKIGFVKTEKWRKTKIFYSIEKGTEYEDEYYKKTK